MQEDWRGALAEWTRRIPGPQQSFEARWRATPQAPYSGYELRELHALRLAHPVLVFGERSR